MGTKDALWPAVDQKYLEEFGPVDPTVDQTARELWPHAEHLARELLHDTAAGYRLLKRAVAAVSRIMADRPNEIEHPVAYLFQTYKRLVLAELEKINGHRVRERGCLVQPSCRDAAASLDRHILVAELVSRMDPWTRNVFEALVLGYTFDEIGHALGSNPHVVRNRFRLSLRRVKDALDQSVHQPWRTHDQAGDRKASATPSGTMRIRSPSPSTLRRRTEVGKLQSG